MHNLTITFLRKHSDFSTLFLLVFQTYYYEMSSNIYRTTEYIDGIPISIYTLSSNLLTVFNCIQNRHYSI